MESITLYASSSCYCHMLKRSGDIIVIIRIAACAENEPEMSGSAAVFRLTDKRQSNAFQLIAPGKRALLYANYIFSNHSRFDSQIVERVFIYSITRYFSAVISGKSNRQNDFTFITGISYQQSAGRIIIEMIPIGSKTLP